jgi:outer membrane protein insertion porin family
MRWPTFSVLLIALALALPTTRAWALGEPITDVRVRGAARTDEETVRSIAGVSIGQTLESDTLDVVRERLHTAGLFSDVNVYWEPYQDGVRVNIVIAEKFPWAPLPTFSYSPGNISGGVFVGHGNLFGAGKRGIIGGRLSNVDSGALAVYEDPAVIGSWVFFNLKGKFQLQIIPEYSNCYADCNAAHEGMELLPMRNTKLRSYGGEINLGVAWLRKVRTSIGWTFDFNDVLWSSRDKGNINSVAIPEVQLPDGRMVTTPAAASARRGAINGTVTFDFRARQHAVMYGNSLGFSLDVGNTTWGSDSKLDYWKASTSYEHGIRFFRRHNLILRVGGNAGDNLPLWSENSAGGTNLRGYLYRQFQGDTHLRSTVEYHFPLFSLWGLDVRGLIFNDTAAIWYRKLPEPTIDGTAYEPRNDGRQFLPPEYLRKGFIFDQDTHSSTGAGIRFYLKSVAVPLVGLDVGWGIGTKEPPRIILVMGV